MADIVESKLVADEITILHTGKDLKLLVLNYLFRYICFIDAREKILTLDSSLVEVISKNTLISPETVGKIVRQFLVNLVYFKKFLSCMKFTWNHNLYRFKNKMRVYLHKAYHLAPVFGYQRAKKNLDTLLLLMKRRYHYPCFTTQLAIIIFVTDRNNPKPMFNEPILQKNLRAFCNCSAYAFHRARNKLKINNKGQVY